MNLFKRAPTRRPLSCPLCKTSVLECLSNRRHATDPPSQRARRGTISVFHGHTSLGDGQRNVNTMGCISRF